MDELLRMGDPRAVDRALRDRGHRGRRRGYPQGPRRCTGIAMANRDPRCLLEPGDVRSNRKNAKFHPVLRSGPHFCLGNNLARLEAWDRARAGGAPHALGSRDPRRRSAVGVQCDVLCAIKRLDAPGAAARWLITPAPSPSTSRAVERRGLGEPGALWHPNGEWRAVRRTPARRARVVIEHFTTLFHRVGRRRSAGAGDPRGRCRHRRGRFEGATTEGAPSLRGARRRLEDGSICGSGPLVQLLAYMQHGLPRRPICGVNTAVPPSQAQHRVRPPSTSTILSGDVVGKR